MGWQNNFWFLFLLSLFLPPFANLVTASEKKIFCYYSSFAQTRQGAGNFLPEDINPHLCTHIIYAFVDISEDGRDLTPFNRNDQGPNGLYARTLALKKKNPSLKILLAVGGWQIGSKPFIPMVRTEENRKIWVANVVDYLRRHGFDGFDVDWEFPATRGSPAEDKFRFTAVMKDLYTAFAEEASATGRDKLILTMATASGTYYISQSYEPEKIINYLDFMLLMTYNYHGQWEKVTGHHSGLYPHRNDPKYGEKGQLYQQWSIDYWLEVGIPKDKLIVGIPTYAMTFTLADQSQHDVGAPVTGGGRMGQYTRETGIMAYYEVCENLQRNGWDTAWIDEQAVPYAYGQDQWAGYEDTRSVTLKAKNIVSRDLAGAFVWSVEMGDYRGKCGQGQYPLLRAIHEIIRPDYPVESDFLGHGEPSLRPNKEEATASQSINSKTPTPSKEERSNLRRNRLKGIKHRKFRKISTPSTRKMKKAFRTTSSITGESSTLGRRGMKTNTLNPGISTRAWHRTSGGRRYGKKHKKWKVKPNINEAASRTSNKSPDGSDQNSVQDSQHNWHVQESKWWPGRLYDEDDDRINARATGRPRYIPLGYTSEGHTTTVSTHAHGVDESVMEISTKASASAANSKNYCDHLGVGTFAHPESCDRFLICLPGSWRKYPPHVMACPVGTRYLHDRLPGKWKKVKGDYCLDLLIKLRSQLMRKGVGKLRSGVLLLHDIDNALNAEHSKQSRYNMNKWVL
ncbi:chitinase-3-like protein 1 [Plakobranchus ocellatus]|uniref:Chitinase-3-like protein 1 n=1 Tax=Plakobranchus ocellatus TaxID=259542 RepID=A0AAV4AZV0_9GAST|nr:chitinase-3-like protein 1 [Plakobranchus ocellatus]